MRPTTAGTVPAPPAPHARRTNRNKTLPIHKGSVPGPEHGTEAPSLKSNLRATYRWLDRSRKESTTIPAGRKRMKRGPDTPPQAARNRLHDTCINFHQPGMASTDPGRSQANSPADRHPGSRVASIHRRDRSHNRLPPHPEKGKEPLPCSIERRRTVALDDL